MIGEVYKNLVVVTQQSEHVPCTGCIVAKIQYFHPSVCRAEECAILGVFCSRPNSGFIKASVLPAPGNNVWKQ